MSRGAPVAVALAALLAAAAAQAHQRSVSYSTWRLDERGASVHVRVSQLDLSRLGLAFLDTGGPTDPVAAALAQGLVLRAGDAPCPLELAPARRPAPEGYSVYTWRVRCPKGARAITSTLFHDVAPSHLHFARVAEPDGAGQERVLSRAQPTWPLPAADGAPVPAHTSVTDYARLGVEHILSGWDHLAFVLALLLLAATLGEVAALVTAFTVAHSVTLGLATLGVVRPEPAAVEALIGFSIALVAAENGWILAGRDRVVPWIAAGAVAALALLPSALSPTLLLGVALFTACHFGLLRRAERPARLRAAVAFAFGLVHGFGFAGVLTEMALETSHLVPALFGFNLGVELGQLAVVLLVWPLLRALSRVAGGRPARLVAELGSAAICGLGTYWFLVRALG